jgi:hypothetical protein
VSRPRLSSSVTHKARFLPMQPVGP